MSTAHQEQAGPETSTEPTPPSPPRPAWSRWLLGAGIVLAIVLFYLLGLQRYFSWDYIRQHLDFWRAQVEQHQLLAIVIVFGVYVTVTALSLPAAALLSLAIGAVLGRWLGTAVVSVAATVGATLAFLSSRYLFRDAVQRRLGPKLEALNKGIERDGAFYLFTLRLIPAFPFFLVNLGMGLTRMRVWTFAWVSWLGMLPGTFVYVNAGQALQSIDSPRDILSWPVLLSFALLGILPLTLRKAIQWQVWRYWRRGLLGLAGILLLLVLAVVVRNHRRYATADQMSLPVQEYNNAEYPEDPAARSVHFGQYAGRSLQLVRKDDTHFDFVLEPDHPHIARIVFRDVDVSLMTPGRPAWTKEDSGLTRIALTDRQWNRQQVRFDRDSAHLEVSGGNGFEKANLYTAELAKNCLNAGLWEVLLFVKESEEKRLYYQGWFTFPLGHYQQIFEKQTGLSYSRHWYYLEHWFDPAGTSVRLEGLRQVKEEREVPTVFDRTEAILAEGEQARKRRTVIGDNLLAWGDFYDGRKVRFASFIPPGRYSVNHPWKNGYWRMDHFDRAILRQVVSPATDKPLQELELVFSSTHSPGACRFLVSGFDLNALPRLAEKEYPKGLYMPMGIGVPPFFQSYPELEKQPPDRSPYFSVMLDDEGRWLDHHSLAIDGPVLHRDATEPDTLHVYLLSYERHSLIGHFKVAVGDSN